MKNKANQFAWTVTVGEKGQIVIPKQARALFDIQPGDTLIVLGDRHKGLAIPPKGLFAQLAAAIFEEEGDDDGDTQDLS